MSDSQTLTNVLAWVSLGYTTYEVSAEHPDQIIETTPGIQHILQIDGPVGAIAVSPDGNYLLIGDRDPVLTSAPGAPATYAVDILRIGPYLSDHIRFAVDASEGGVGDIAIDADGTVLVATTGAGTLHAFDVKAADPQVHGVAGAAPLSAGAELYTSSMGSYVLVEEPQSPSATIAVFSPSTGTITASADMTDLGVQGDRIGAGAIDGTRGLVVDVSYNHVNILDLALHPVADLSGYFQKGAVVGAAFSVFGDDLFLWDGPAGKVLLFDTTSWSQVGVFDVGHTVGPGVDGAPYHMDFDGGWLKLTAGADMYLIPADIGYNLPGPGQTIAATEADGGVGSNGDDTITGLAEGANYLRGGYGADLIRGGGGHNDVNGNQGADTIVGKSTVGDWLLGGQGGDAVDATASTGHNIINGNLGNDTLQGGAGGDSLRGGQGDDLLAGGSGADWITGDLGDDTLSGGQGADVFHVAGGSDVVTDFTPAEGDRVEIDRGVFWQIVQVGADARVDVSTGGHLTLQHTDVASLPGGWIIQA